MKMKRIVALMATVAMTAGVLAGCGSSNNAASGNGNNSEAKTVKVGLTTDEGGLNDKSFNQTANEGAQRAVKELGIEYSPIEAQKKEDFEPNIQALVDDGADITFAIGYQLADAVANASKSNADSKFAIIDSVVDGDNVVSVTFKEEEGSFLMGVLAGLTTKTNKVGFIGGKDQDTIVKFEAGFAAGVKAVNPEAAAGLISADGTSAGTTVKYADSFSDTNKGYELAKSLYESGCDVIYHAAGGVGIGMFQAAKEARENGKDVWAIGVDMDQALSLPDYSQVILASMMKRVDNATFDVIKSVVDGEFKGQILNLGIAEGGVGIAETTNASEESLTKAKDFEDKIKAGEFTVPGTRQEVMDFSL